MSGNCKLYEDLLVQEVLGEITEKERAFLKSHLESCPECRGALAALADTVGILQRERIEAAPAGLAERTLKRVESLGKRFVTAASPYRDSRLLAPGTWQVRRSLVGWMVAASILVMGVASLIPGMMGADSRRGIQACQGNMRIIAVALRQYAVDHDGFYPQGRDWYKSLDYEYLQNMGALMCPGRLAVGAPSDREVDYIYNSDKLSMSIAADYPILWDRKAAHDRLGRNVLFGGGKVAWMGEEDFERLLIKYKINEAELLR